MSDIKGEILPHGLTGEAHEQVDQLKSDIATFVVGAILLVGFLWKSVVSVAEEMERQYNRKELRDAYKRRHQWKTSDILHLQSLDVSDVARQRMKRLVGKGRPVVKPHQPLAEALVTKLANLKPLFDSESSPEERAKSFKQWPWWKHHVEALYRGEYAIAKKNGERGPSDHAERKVGNRLGISQPKVHAIAGEIRKMRKEDPGSADFPEMTLAQYEEWMSTGKTNRFDWIE